MKEIIQTTETWFYRMMSWTEHVRYKKDLEKIEIEKKIILNIRNLLGYKAEEIVKSRHCQLPEGTRYIEKEDVCFQTMEQLAEINLWPIKYYL